MHYPKWQGESIGFRDGGALHARLEFSPFDLRDFRLSYDTCTDTNGPSSNIFVDETGRIDERVPGDPAYWDPNEARPWARQFAIAE